MIGGFNAKPPRRQDAKKIEKIFAPPRLCVDIVDDCTLQEH